MSAEEEEDRFELSNICWICNKLFNAEDNKARNHCHIPGKYRGAAYWKCYINFNIRKNVPVIFQNLKRYFIAIKYLKN